MLENQFDSNIIQKYKQCQKINVQKLRQARNIEDLVNIKIERVGLPGINDISKSNLNVSRGPQPGQPLDQNSQQKMDHSFQDNSQNRFNINYDPLMFRHKVPYIADRDFLLNCASLESSFNPKGLAGGMGPKIYSYALQKGRKSKSQNQANGGRPSQITKLAQVRQLAQQMNINMEVSDDSTNGEPEENKKVNDYSQSQYSRMTEQRHASQEDGTKDPVTLLKKFFKPNQYKSTALDTNFYANRYKKKLQEQAQANSAFQSEKKSYILQKQYREDQDDYQLPEINRKKSIENTSSSQKDKTPRSNLEKNPASNTRLNRLNFPQMLNDIERMFESDHNEEVSSDNDNYIQQQQREIREQMMAVNDYTHFQNEDGLTGDAVLEKKAMQLYQKKHEKQQIDAKKDLMTAAGAKPVEEQALSSDPESQADQENNKEHLCNYLTRKITEAKQERTRPESQSWVRTNEEGVYHASCLSKVQAVKSVGYAKIEESFRNRVNRLGVDLSFKKAMHSKFKQKQVPREQDPTLDFRKSQIKEQREKYGGPGMRPNYVKSKLNEVKGPPEKSIRKDRRDTFITAYSPNKIPQRDIYSADVPQYLLTTHDPDAPEQVVLQTQPAEMGMFPNEQQEELFYQEQERLLDEQQYNEENIHSGDQNEEEKHRELQEFFERQEIEQKSEPTIGRVSSSHIQSRATGIQAKTESLIPYEQKEGELESQNQDGTLLAQSQLRSSHKKLLEKVTASYGSGVSQSSEDPAKKNQNTINSSLLIQTIGLQKQLNEKNSQTRLSSDKLDQNKKSLNVDLPPQVQYVQQNYFTDSEAPNMSKRISKQRLVSDISFNSRIPGQPIGISGVPTQNEENFITNARNSNLNNSQSESRFQQPSHITVKTKTLPEGKGPLGELNANFADSLSQKEHDSPFRDAFKELHSPQSERRTVNFPQAESTYVPTGRFKSKRFERLPRFTIYLNRDDQAEFVKEYTISLSPEFLNYLMNAQGRAAMSDQDNGLHVGQGSNAKKFDPFDKVVLAKGIDNSILTSFRTLKKENNIISDTLKIIHNKFNPLSHQQSKNFFFHNIKQNQPYDITSPSKKSSIQSQQQVPIMYSPQSNRYYIQKRASEDLQGYMSDSAAYAPNQFNFTSYIPQPGPPESNQSTIVAVANPVRDQKGQEIIYLQIQKQSNGQSQSSYKNSSVISPSAGQGKHEAKIASKRNSIELKRVMEEGNVGEAGQGDVTDGQTPADKVQTTINQSHFAARNDSVTGGADSVISEDNPLISGKVESKYYHQGSNIKNKGINQSIESDQILEAISERGEKIKIEDVNKSEIEMKSPPDINMSPKMQQKPSLEPGLEDMASVKTHEFRVSQELKADQIRRSIASKKSMNNTMSSAMSKQPTERPTIPEIVANKKDETNSPMTRVLPSKVSTAANINQDIAHVSSQKSGLRTKSQQQKKGNSKQAYKTSKVNPMDLAFGPPKPLNYGYQVDDQDFQNIDETYYASEIQQYKDENPDVQISQGLSKIDLQSAIAQAQIQGFGLPSQPGTAYQQMRSYERGLVSPFGVHHYDEMSRPQTDNMQNVRHVKAQGPKSPVDLKQSSVGKGGGFQFSQSQKSKRTVKGAALSPSKQFQMGGVLSSQGYNSDAEKLIRKAVKDKKNGGMLINEALNNSIIVPIPEHMKSNSQSPEAQRNKSMNYSTNGYQFEHGVLTSNQGKEKKISQYFDELFNKGKQYVKQYIREDFIEANNCIFRLEKSHIWKSSVKKQSSQIKEERSTISDQAQNGVNLQNQDIFVNGFNI